MIQMLSAPFRSEKKAMRFPSGLKRGWASKAIPLVSRVALPTVIGTV